MIFNLIKKSGLNYYYLPHPGYNEYLNEDNPNKVVDSELSQLINKAKITISTCSSFNYLLKKYIEISLSGSIIAGNFPETEENLYKDCMCLLDETDSDEIIIEKLKTILELSDTNSKLLRDLSDKAPGTFNHSIQVANLAEAAASEINANVLLIRVGALYHDIGKIKNPLFFSENQLSEDSPHDRISPEKSAQIIINHVKDGVEIAKKTNLTLIGRAKGKRYTLLSGHKRLKY